MSQLQRRKEPLSLFERDWDHFFDHFFGLPAQSKEKPVRRPVTHLEETPTEYIMQFELPGYKKEEISVEYDDGNLTVEAKHNEDNSRSSFYGQYRLPNTVGMTNLEAKHENGLLYLHVPKKEISTKKKIEISSL